MKVEYRTPAGSGGYSVLADENATTDTGERISGYQPAFRKTPDIQALAMSGVQFVADRGNGVWTLKFNVDRIHASAATAVSFVATHAAVFAGYQASIDLQITVGATVLHLLGAALTALTPAPQSDQSSFFSYEFTGPSYG